MKLNLQAQLQQCKKILNSDVEDIYLHCVGNAINRGINLALTLIQESNNGFGYEANTSTIEMIGNIALYHLLLLFLLKRNICSF